MGMWASASLWASRPLCGPWTSPTHSPLPNGPFPSLVHHPWASTCQSHTSFILNRNLAPHRCLVPLTIILPVRPSPRSLLWALWVCLVQYTILAPTVKKTRLAPTTKKTCPIPFAKGFQVHTPPVPILTAKGTSITLPPLPPHHHRLWYHLLGR